MEQSDIYAISYDENFIYDMVKSGDFDLNFDRTASLCKIAKFSFCECLKRAELCCEALQCEFEFWLDNVMFNKQLFVFELSRMAWAEANKFVQQILISKRGFNYAVWPENFGDDIQIMHVSAKDAINKMSDLVQPTEKAKKELKKYGISDE